MVRRTVRESCRRSGRRVEANPGSFALGRGRDFKEFTRLEAKHVRNDVGGELLDLRIEIANDGIVVTASILNSIFNLGQRRLQGGETFDGAELRVGFGEGK